MRRMPALPLPAWTIAAPAAAWLLFAANLAGYRFGLGVSFALLLAAGLVLAVVAAVHHAEIVAHRVGEPFGTLVLALAITAIEVTLIVSVMVIGGPPTAMLARDTVFATVMIILTGIVGLCLVVGGARHHEQSFGLHGVSAMLAAIAAIVVLTLVLPNYTVTEYGAAYSSGQLAFIALVSIALYVVFVLVQTVSHRDYFLPAEAAQDAAAHAAPPSVQAALLSAGLLGLCLGVVVLLSAALAPEVGAVVARLGAPKSLVGVIIAALVLLPEGLAAVRAARADRLQTSLNLALGSAMASIGLTIPAVAAFSLIASFPLTLGIDLKSQVLLALALFVSGLSLGTGRTTVLQGSVLLVIFSVYLFTTIVP